MVEIHIQTIGHVISQQNTLLARRFLGITDTLDIGVNEGSEYEMFGDIRDIEIDPDGRLFILDTRAGAVRIFNSDGSYAGSIGRPGIGPGEFEHAESVSLLDSGATAIVASRDHRIQIFARDGRGTYRYRDGFTKQGIGGGTSCAVNGHLYLIGYRPGVDGIVHRFTLDGKWLTAFGAVYQSKSPFVTSVLSGRGMIACSNRYGVIAVVEDNIPAVTGYAEDGSMLWQVKFGDFKPISRIQRGPSSMIFPKPRVSAEVAQQLARLVFPVAVPRTARGGAGGVR